MKRSVCHVQLCYGAKAKEGTTSSMWITSQDNPAIKIIYFEGMGLNGLYPNEVGFQRERRDWLIGACLPFYTPYFFSFSFLSVFCYFDSFPLLSFFLNARSCNDSPLEVAMVVVVLLFTARTLNILPAMTVFYHFSL